MICHQVKEVNCDEELRVIFQDDANMDVLMNTGFTSKISLEKKDTIVRYKHLQYPKMYLTVAFLHVITSLEMLHPCPLSVIMDYFG